MAVSTRHIEVLLAGDIFLAASGGTATTAGTVVLAMTITAATGAALAASNDIPAPVLGADFAYARDFNEDTFGPF